jgi:hypothetical protein
MMGYEEQTSLRAVDRLAPGKGPHRVGTSGHAVLAPDYDFIRLAANAATVPPPW